MTDRGSVEVSALLAYLISLDLLNKQKIRLLFDECGGENKNVNVGKSCASLLHRNNRSGACLRIILTFQ